MGLASGAGCGRETRDGEVHGMRGPSKAPEWRGRQAWGCRELGHLNREGRLEAHLPNSVWRGCRSCQKGTIGLAREY
jgi:hypothetical protein